MQLRIRETAKKIAREQHITWMALNWCAIHRSRRFVMLRVVHDCGTTVKGDRSGNPTGWPAPNPFSRSAWACSRPSRSSLYLGPVDSSRKRLPPVPSIRLTWLLPLPLFTREVAMAMKSSLLAQRVRNASRGVSSPIDESRAFPGPAGTTRRPT